jgi:hypothetical protein
LAEVRWHKQQPGKSFVSGLGPSFQTICWYEFGNVSTQLFLGEVLFLVCFWLFMYKTKISLLNISLFSRLFTLYQLCGVPRSYSVACLLHVIGLDWIGLSWHPCLLGLAGNLQIQISMTWSHLHISHFLYWLSWCHIGQRGKGYYAGWILNTLLFFSLCKVGPGFSQWCIDSYSFSLM